MSSCPLLMQGSWRLFGPEFHLLDGIKSEFLSVQISNINYKYYSFNGVRGTVSYRQGMGKTRADKNLVFLKLLGLLVAYATC